MVINIGPKVDVGMGHFCNQQEWKIKDILI